MIIFWPKIMRDFFGQRSCVIFIWPERWHNFFFGPIGYVIFFWAKRLHDFFWPRRFCDFVLARKVVWGGAGVTNERAEYDH